MAHILIIRKNNNGGFDALLHRRSYCIREPGTWGIPGKMFK